MKKNIKIISLIQTTLLLCSCNLQGSSSLSNSSSNQDKYSDYRNEVEETDVLNPIEIVADFSKVVEPPLLKKIDMYNAGCIEPLSNYDRDFSRIKDLNPLSMRLDVSIGKSDGSAGQYLVSDDYDYYDYDENTGKYKVDKNSLKYDFKKLDSVVKYLNDYDVLPYLSWAYIPYPLQNDGKWNDLDNNIENWQEVWEEVYYQYAKHYLDSGVKVGYHEIYNEPDLEILKCWGVFNEEFDGFLDWEDFCLGEKCDPGKGVYPDMYEYALKGILRADPNATVGGPAFALGEIGVEDWTGLFPRILEKDLQMDFYSFHSYLDGETWFMPEYKRAKGEKNELEKVVEGLGKHSNFLNTSVHINEYSYLNNENGATNGLESAFNYYGAASDTIDGIMEIVDRTSVQLVSWAQFMESTGGYDPYGLIEKVNGSVKAAYNAIKIYQDMPVWRYDSSFSNNNAGLNSLVSATDDKISILVWNENDVEYVNNEYDTSKDKGVTIKLDNAFFDKGIRRVYKIDKDHASYFDKTVNSELVAQFEKEVKTNDTIWSGTIPAEGLVYITINKEDVKDFNNYEKRESFANDIKTSYYYEDRFRGLEGSREHYDDYVNEKRGSYSHFDRSNWTMYLGMGSSTGINGKYVCQAHANGSILCDSLPNKFNVKLQTEGDLKMNNKNTTLGMRIDFYDEETQSYTESVYFHNGLYRDTRNPIAQDSKLNGLPLYPWGTKINANQNIEFNDNVWEIDLSKYAPKGWDASKDKALISFDMQNTGANTRAMFKLYK